ncbi:MAG: NADH-quinone oxidoreductase subunit NuoN [Salinisphaera sp.]|nr:NADH-quinone oxidoreductase subunit NuoN [Salinisphaera sp.]
MNITPSLLLAMLPFFIVTATAVAVMASISWRRHHFFNATITVVGLNLALASLIPVFFVTPVHFGNLMVVDNFTLLYTSMMLISALACSTLSHAYLEGLPGRQEEYYLLMMFAVMGGIALAASTHMATFFIGLELLSVPIYGMAAYTYNSDRHSLEAGIKYLVLSAAASAFLLFGMALLYAASGSLAFDELAAVAAGGGHRAWLITGVGLMVVALGFKLSLVPFHLWTPDVYGGAPAPTSSFLATVGKVAVFAVLLRFFMLAPSVHDARLGLIIGVIAFITMLVGTLLALRQTDIKRLLGYSAIAHFGYLLTAIVAIVAAGGFGAFAVETTGMYLITYVAATLGAFGVVTLVSSPYQGKDAAELYNYTGLFWRRPYLAAVLTVMMLSLAGIPLTAGLIGKLYIIALAVNAQLWWLVGGIVVGSAIALYYYLRVTINLYMRPRGELRRDAPTDWGSRSGGLMVMLLAVAVLLMGVYPEPWILLVQLAGLGAG